MKRKFMKLATGLGLAVLATAQARAEAPRNCAPRSTVIERLASTYGETLRIVGLGAQGAVIEVFASVATGSWTITATRPNGLTCLIASGKAFETVVAPSPRPVGVEA